jgi:guanine deaminase
MSIPFSQRPSPVIVIFGTFIDSPTPRTLRVRRDHYCIISSTTGKITHLAPVSATRDDPVRILGEEVYHNSVVIRLLSSQFVCPGMIDTHCHAPQYRQLGSKNNLPLVDAVNVLC